MAKKRLDQLLVDRGLVDSRSRAQAVIRASKVRLNGEVLLKPSQKLDEQTDFQFEGLDHPWASRGGLKLAAALQHFDIDPAGRVCLDVGASTGGFTDVLLSAGAARVYAVDVGRDQLVPRLRDDPRVVVMDGLNARDLVADLIPERPALIVSDVSFISLRLALPSALDMAAPGGRLVTLVKPQFEAGREHIGKGGIIQDPAVHDRVVHEIEAWVGGLDRWRVDGVTPSPILGSNGNKEFLLAATCVL